MTEEKPVPIARANRLSGILDLYHQVHGGERFPVNVEQLIRDVPETFQTGEPIVVQGSELDPEFEGAMFNLNAGEAAPSNWAVVYNTAISSPGRIRFTLAHELGHYLCHRKIQDHFNCNEADTLEWDTPERQMENEANQFASYLLMPRKDFEAQIGSSTIDLDVLGSCADRYGVSLTAAVRKWLEFTKQRAVLVMSYRGIVQYACGSAAGKWCSIALNKKLANGKKRPLPANCATMTSSMTNVDRAGTEMAARVWFSQEPADMPLREMRIVSDQYRQTMTLLLLPPEVKPWERDTRDADGDDDGGLESTIDRFERRGQPVNRS
jgi:hypothetical protein